MRARCLAWIAALALLSPGCDDGDDGTDAGPDGVDAATGEDAGPTGEDAGAGDPDAGAADEDAGPGVDGGPGAGGAHCDATDLIIEAVDPGAGITVFNPTDAAIAIDGSSYAFCSRPMYPTLASIESGVTIAAGGNHTFDWPSTFADTDDGGEIALYRTAPFGTADNLIDFVCWGTGHGTPNRQGLAESAGLWADFCAGAIGGDALTRVPDTDGTDAASYDPTGATEPLACP